MRIEMDVGNERNVASLGTQHLGNLTDALGLFYPLSGETDIGGTGIGDALALCRTRLDIVGRRIGHRLHPHRPLAAHGNVTHRDTDSSTAFIIE